ncbi:DUF4212 domain-containing protein [Pelomonas sp. KK5]|uniref:DUF4212 domain-containing protein n=1 Tax=Pelomonas sp. KK5 TaxID=1855730 RepID=UPI00097C2A54|nr:DUF4212 domain-containing protein [Pelomonas sp. KK5]
MTGEDQSARNRRYWQRTCRLTAALLLLWALVCFGLTWFARELSGWRFFGWPFSFWVAAQGALFVFLAIVVFYAWAMNRLDRLSR